MGGAGTRDCMERNTTERSMGGARTRDNLYGGIDHV